MGRFWLLHFFSFFFISLSSWSLSFLKVIPVRQNLCRSLKSCLWHDSLSVCLLLIGWLFTTSTDQELLFSFKRELVKTAFKSLICRDWCVSCSFISLFSASQSYLSHMCVVDQLVNRLTWVTSSLFLITRLTPVSTKAEMLFEI